MLDHSTGSLVEDSHVCDSCLDLFVPPYAVQVDKGPFQYFMICLGTQPRGRLWIVCITLRMLLFNETIRD